MDEKVEGGERQEVKMTDTRRRVKLYELNAERQWDDKGTGEDYRLHNFVDRDHLVRSCIFNIRGETEGDFFGGAQRGGNRSSTQDSFTFLYRLFLDDCRRT